MSLLTAVQIFLPTMHTNFYILTLRMTERVTKVMNEDKKTLLETAAFFIVRYAPWFRKFYLVDKSPPTMNFLLSNLPSTSKISGQILGRDCLPACNTIAGNCLSTWFCYPLAWMTLRRSWSPIRWSGLILTFEIPDQFQIVKPELPVILMSTTLW